MSSRPGAHAFETIISPDLGDLGGSLPNEIKLNKTALFINILKCCICGSISKEFLEIHMTIVCTKDKVVEEIKLT